MIKSQALDIHTATKFVVDEADMTLDMGFLDQVDQIASHFPDDLQMMVFSATIPAKIATIFEKIYGKSGNGGNSNRDCN